MSKLFIIILFILTLFGIKSCQKETDFEKRTQFLKTYFKEKFPEFKIQDGEYLFILPGGCIPCKQSMLLILNNQAPLVNGLVKGVILSHNTTLLYREINFNQFNNVLIDKTDKLDRMAFGIYGISMLRIENGVITGVKSLTSDDFKMGFEHFLYKPYLKK